MTRYLLDTNIVSDLLRHPKGRVAAHIRKVGEARICTSIIVAAELRFGAWKRNSSALDAKLKAVTAGLDVLPLQAPADEIYGRIRTELERAGTPISANDMLIAAHAMALDCALVTDNTREFSHVVGLVTVNWLRED